MNLHVDPAAQQVLAEPAVGTGFLQGLIEALERLVMELTAQIVVSHVRTHRVAGNRHAFDHGMRVETQDVAVLAGPRLSLVGVAHQVLLTRELARHEAPLQPGGKTSAPPTAQAGLLDGGNHLILIETFAPILAQNFLQCRRRPGTRTPAG